MTVAVIGGGYAGMAAAVELTAAGLPVHVYEASRSLGGRARRAQLGDEEDAVLDNGQHLLVGAYRETLRLMRTVGADPDKLLLRQELHLEYPDILRLHAPPWPAPLHLAAALLGAKGLNWGEKWAALRFMQYLKQRRFQLQEDTTVVALLAALEQPAKLRRYLWEPLCLATLNTPVGSASAQVFLNVLRDTLGADRAASQLLLPKTDLSRLFPEPAAAYIEARGGQVLRSRRIAAIAATDQGWRVDDQPQDYSHLILATAPHHLAPLISPFPAMAEMVERLSLLQYEPIVTVYLQYPAHVRLSQPMLGGYGEGEGLSQWLFDRGPLVDSPGLLAAVISAGGPHQSQTGDELADTVHQEIAQRIPHLPPPLWHKVITEKRATFACTPGLVRLATATPLPGLLLAGDHIAGDYPATIESAVRSGIAAAQIVLKETSRQPAKGR